MVDVYRLGLQANCAEKATRMFSNASSTLHYNNCHRVREFWNKYMVPSIRVCMLHYIDEATVKTQGLF